MRQWTPLGQRGGKGGSAWKDVNGLLNGDRELKIG